MTKLKPSTPVERKLIKTLDDLCRTIRSVSDAIDQEMKTPQSYQRGQHIAVLMNTLDMQNDLTWHFVLGKKLPVKPLEK